MAELRVDVVATLPRRDEPNSEPRLDETDPRRGDLDPRIGDDAVVAVDFLRYESPVETRRTDLP